MRIFLSVNIPEVVKQELQLIQAKLRSRTKNIRWIAAESLHITLKFIGTVPESELDRIQSILQPVADTVSRFELELGGFGCFPPRGAPSVFWIGVNYGEKQLMTLADSITVALIQAEIQADHKPFVPHITIGRAKRGAPAVVPVDIQIAAEQTRFQVESFYVMESLLQPQGAVYLERCSFKLKG